MSLSRSKIIVFVVVTLAIAIAIICGLVIGKSDQASNESTAPTEKASEPSESPQEISSMFTATFQPSAPTTDPNASTEKPPYNLDLCRVKECGKSGPKFVAPRIAGGRLAKEDEFPFQVSISLEKSPKNIFCGGSVIGDRWVVTAASCFMGQPASSLRVSVGILNKSEVPKQSIPMEKYWAHPKYLNDEYDYDIALVKTAKSINESSSHFVSPICLPFEDVDSADVKVATVSGFGKVEEKGEYSTRLRTAKLKIMSQEECKDQFSFVKPEIMLCAWDSLGNSGACTGDTGGPLATKSANGSYVLKGITSWGGCEGSVSNFAKVSPHLDWICETMYNEPN